MTNGRSSARPPAGSAEQRMLRALARSRSVTAEMSDELLTHVPDLGDLATGRVLDAWVEQAADTLRALSEAMEERLLDAAAGSGTTLGRSTDEVRR